MVKSPEVARPMDVNEKIDADDTAEKEVAEAVNKIGSDFSDEERARLAELRKMQYNLEPPQLTEEESVELRKLIEAEEQSKHVVLSEDEHKRLAELRRIQIRSSDLSKEEAKELTRLAAIETQSIRKKRR